tara:strand:+ start:445 stop:645 length:201 start_codon:yes stop_codon:yes gene_type:complete
MKYIDTKAINDSLVALSEILTVDDINVVEKMISQRVSDHYDNELTKQVAVDLNKLNIKSADVDPVF